MGHLYQARGSIAVARKPHWPRLSLEDMAADYKADFEEVDKRPAS